MLTPNEVLTKAKAAYETKALQIWERDERQDRGSCGGAILELKGGRKLTKEAQKMGLLVPGSTFVSGALPAEIRSQNADIYQDAMRAFRQVIEAEGYSDTIKRFWTYID